MRGVLGMAVGEVVWGCWECWCGSRRAPCRAGPLACPIPGTVRVAEVSGVKGGRRPSRSDRGSDPWGRRGDPVTCVAWTAPARPSRARTKSTPCSGRGPGPPTARGGWPVGRVEAVGYL